jgi:hypothetical protein
MLNIGLVKGYRGLLYPTPLYHLANRRADGGLCFNYTSKVEPIY